MGHLSELVGDVLEGYRTLERTERGVAQRTSAEHEELGHLWTESLALYLEGMTGTHAVEDPDEDKRFARVVRMQFFALGIGHSKAALDATLVGNYHHAFFSVRYMAELLVQAAYVRLRPGEARRWYKHHAKPRAADFPPKFETAFKAVRASVPDQQAAQRVYDIAKEMDAFGAHPSQEVLLQTLDQAAEHARVGVRYEQHHCIAALDRGLLLTLALLQELGAEVSIPADEWNGKVDVLWQKRRTAMARYHAEGAPDEPESATTAYP